MRGLVKERGSLAGKHDFDSLSTDSDIEVRSARYAEIRLLADMAHRLVPGVQMSADVLSSYFAFDPETILTFSRQGRLLGAIAFLYLNDRGHDALLLDEICLTHPEREFLAVSNEDVSATYIWACAITGRGICGYGKVAAHLRKSRYVNADVFAQPSTKAGRDWLIATCFKQTQSFQPDLWCYQRSWNRVPMPMPASTVSTRSYADARH
ncbi:MAG TPA: hypothetical protein VKR55_01185 [Bradyrhizobium sp.]|uniref:hypothetical protein n=1 Tax=Bradyrhizobium sp. TaxID=376 RepID=UPI002B7EE8B2|nr:hypothetical protein [Bradyrhizobium sp.]HLZ00744.1 hypothetical protein [Bradyrhizobium sp.]